MAAIWQNLLGLEQVGIHDDFFDLGGHSLLAAQVVSRIRGRFGIELPVGTVLQHRTISALAEEIVSLQLDNLEEEDLELLRKEVEESGISQTGPLSEA